MSNRNSVILSFIFVLLFCLSQSVYAQQNGYSAFIEPVVKFQTILNQTSFVTGGRFGFVIHERFTIGGGYYSLLNSLQIAPINSQDARLYFNMGGLELESMMFDNKSVHVSILLFAGGGALYKSAAANNNINFSTNNFLVWEPQLLSGTNILNWLNINFGLGYRIITYTNRAVNPDADRLKGLFGMVTFRIHTQ